MSKRVTVSLRLSPLARALVEEEASIQGVSRNQFICEAAIARAAWERGRRGEPLGEVDILEEVMAALERQKPPEGG